MEHNPLLRSRGDARPVKWQVCPGHGRVTAEMVERDDARPAKWHGCPTHRATLTPDTRVRAEESARAAPNRPCCLRSAGVDPARTPRNTARPRAREARLPEPRLSYPTTSSFDPCWPMQATPHQ